MDRLREHVDVRPMFTVASALDLLPVDSTNRDSMEIRIPVNGALPIILALFAMLVLIMVRPRSSYEHLVSDSVGAPAGEVGFSGEGQAIDVAAESEQVLVAPVDESLSASPSALAPLFTREVAAWESSIVRWADEYALDPNIIATIMQIESCGDPAAESYAGARGLFQVMPFHFSPGEDMNDPDTNAMRGMAFYNEQLRFTGGDVILSFAGYNGGYAASGGSYDQWPAETQRYYYWAKGIYEDALSGANSSPTLDQWLAAGGAGGCQRASVSLGL